MPGRMVRDLSLLALILNLLISTLDNAIRMAYRCCGIRISARIVAFNWFITGHIIEQKVHSQVTFVHIRLRRQHVISSRGAIAAAPFGNSMNSSNNAPPAVSVGPLP